MKVGGEVHPIVEFKKKKKGEVMSEQRLIDANLLIKEISEYERDSTIPIDYTEIIKRQPTIEERRTGKWIRITQGATPEKYMCPFCHRTVEHEGVEYLVSMMYPFCHCGAMMVQEGENNEQID